jgi:hypothetical protein
MNRMLMKKKTRMGMSTGLLRRGIVCLTRVLPL